jgi:N-acetylneuraminic acid mutarotase
MKRIRNIGARMRVCIASCLLLAPMSVHMAAAADDSPTALVPLPKILEIDWRRGPDLPRGFQDSDGGIVGGHLITTGGFTKGQTDVPGKPDKYPRGFLKSTWGQDLSDPTSGWRKLPDFPGDARQELFSIVVNNQLYAWGGFSYTTPFTYKDGYRLSESNGQWRWNELPDLPWPITSSGIAAVGSKIYVMGGSQYIQTGFLTQMDSTGQVDRLGSRLLMFDTAKPAAGWTELASCPGTPRWVQAMAAVNDKLFVIGGASGNDNKTGEYNSIVDNWSYDPSSKQWERLADLPISTGNFPSGQIVFDDRYILLIGGYQYPTVLNPDGSTQPKYGAASKHYPDKEYFSDILVYDVINGTFGRATSMPLNNNLPMAVLDGNQLHLIGGETDNAELDGVHYGHHPDLHLIGEVRVVPEPTSSNGILGLFATGFSRVCSNLAKYEICRAKS